MPWVNFLKLKIYTKSFYKINNVNPIQDGEKGGREGKDVGISHQNFQTFLVLIFLPYCCKIARPYLVPVPNYWTWTKTNPQKKWFFRWNPYKIEIMITSVVEMLELPNFGHMTTLKFYWWRHEHKLWRHNLYFKVSFF